MSKAALQAPLLAALAAQAHAIPLMPTIDAPTITTARQLLDTGAPADALRARDLLVDGVREPIPLHCTTRLRHFFAAHPDVTHVYVGLEFEEDAENGRYAVPVVLAVVGTYPYGGESAVPQLVYLADTAVAEDRFGLSAPLAINAVAGFEARRDDFPPALCERAQRLTDDVDALTADLHGEGMGRVLRANFGVSDATSHLFVLTRDHLAQHPA